MSKKLIVLDGHGSAFDTPLLGVSSFRNDAS